MAPASKADKKAAVDAAAWTFNVVTSVGIIIVNKALMANYDFSYATTLTGLHFATTTLLAFVLRWLGYIQASHLPFPELLKFVFFANFSIVGMNVSLMWNSVGFYQIAKLSMIPVSCLLEVLFDKIRYSRDTKLSIVVVLLGVGVCTITDVSVNAKGFIAAFIAVWSTSLQQYYVHYLQRKYSLSSFNLLGHTAPAQAATLLLVGPFLDYWLTNRRVYAYNYNIVSVVHDHFYMTTDVGFHLLVVLISRYVHYSVMHHCGWDQPQPVHLHWQIHSSVISSTWSYEDNPCVDNGVLLLRERGPESTGNSGHGHSRGRNDLEQLYQWIWRQQEGGSRVATVDILSSSGPITAGQGTRTEHCDQQPKNSVFSNALSSPVRRSLQNYHIAQDSYYPPGGPPSGNGTRSNEPNFLQHQNRDPNPVSSNDSSMDI
ncbi:hypothetical protein GH714_024919 [Hevea brasiliensis]|uniref:Sugar phosphate transporter domain-containing protein n=1 Tax=Hevea brasiliensis TaxID=3981 RepID=A0A6A6LB44_HEVBR|nr:hypothetical protein GH714_024919 [Hevea brasiliensis]